MSSFIRVGLTAIVLSMYAFAFGRAIDAQDKPPAPVTFTTQQDHQDMMEQLGITKLRPGPSGNANAPNAANYDEATANPYPELPNPLVLVSGDKVETAEQWWKQRRPETVEAFEREVYGRVPQNAPTIKWVVKSTNEITLGGVAVIEKELEGIADNSACPSIEVKIAMTLGVPKNEPGPVPTLMMFSFGGFGFGRGPRPATKAPEAKKEEFKTDEAKADEAKKDSPPKAPPRPGFGFPTGPSSSEVLVKAGWGYCRIVPNSIQADNGAGLTRGIIGLTNLGQPRKPDDWGSLRAWAWGASRGLDYLETEPTVAAKRVGIEGVSRYGKASLVTMAFDPRFAVVLVGSSGEGGAKLHRRNFGEAVESLTGSGEYHWMAGNFLKYGAAEAKFGAMTAKDLPVDSHQLIALCAPRPTFISYGIPEKGDANWLDQRGSFMASIAAGPVFRLLGAKDLDRGDDYLHAEMPKVNEGLLAGELAWRQHDGGHTDGPNLPHFIEWANQHFKSK
jgi:hypothetical protein